jgi:hypothetical protein
VEGGYLFSNDANEGISGLSAAADAAGAIGERDDRSVIESEYLDSVLEFEVAGENQGLCFHFLFFPDRVSNHFESLDRVAAIDA